MPRLVWNDEMDAILAEVAQDAGAKAAAEALGISYTQAADRCGQLGIPRAWSKRYPVSMCQRVYVMVAEQGADAVKKEYGLTKSQIDGIVRRVKKNGWHL